MKDVHLTKVWNIRMNPRLALVDTAMSGVRMLDLFSGIGGFHKGFAQAGYKFDWVGFSEIDKYASAVYKHKFKEAEELGDITTIQPGRDLPDYIDILCGGFPCQAFSVAGKRKGFDDTRGTLFFEIARILRHYRDVGKPISCFLLENVKGLLSHDNGRTFATVYRVLNNLGYTIEFQLLNTRWWLPQNRERIYIVGYIGDGSGSKVFPIGEDGEVSDYTSRKNHRKAASMQNGYSRTISSRIHKMGCEDTYIIDKKGKKKNNQDYAATLTGGGHSGGNHSDMDLIKLNQIGTIGKDSEATGVYNPSGIARTIKDGGGMGAKTGLYQIREATKKGYAEVEVGDAINLERPTSKTRRGRVTKGYAQSLETIQHQHTIQPVLTPNRAEKQQNGRRFKEDGEDMFTLTQQDQHGVMIRGGLQKNASTIKNCSTALTEAMGKGGGHVPIVSSIRRLTPKECERLQGFPDNWTSKGVIDGKVVDMSDTQRYKQCGNAVTVDVVQAVAERICPLINKIMSN